MKYLFLSGNTLKIIAAICMAIDHIGAIMFPDNMIFRIIGRISFPIFAFLIAQGCRYTKNKLRYFCVMALFAAVLQIIYSVVTEPLYLNIFFTLSFAILIIYGIQFFADALNRKKTLKIVLAACLVIFLVSIIYIIGEHYLIDYGFWGCMLPAFAYIVPDNKCFRLKFLLIALFALGLYPIVNSVELPVQGYSYLSLIPIFFYNGKRGKYNMKYFFYAFYPIHFALIYGIDMLIKQRM